MIVLVGFMGAGKTTVGRALASLSGKPFVDIDRVIEDTAGTSIPQIFERGGEEAFRALERSVLAQVLAGPEAVVALGGGALGDAATRAALSHTTVVHLKVGRSEAFRRLGGGGGRPMLSLRDPEELYEERMPLYAASATVTVETDGRTPDEIAHELAARWGRSSDRRRERVAVTTPGGSYTVWIGPGLTSAIAEALPPLPHAEKAFVLTHPTLRGMADPLLDALRASGLEVHVLVVDEGEASKSLGTAGSLLTELARLRAHRNDVVLGFGGGVVCDLAGFIASTFSRGMPVIQVPTSLLAQVDAAIGGKTGVNLPEGKNLVGTIHQPRAVVCDTDLLRSLPEPELRSGMAEVIKYGLIADPSILDLVRTRTEDVLERDEATLIELITRSATIKASVVGADEREAGPREVLNYGHTFGHAIERLTGFGTVRHGEAVALGMMAAAHLAAELGRIDEPAVETHRTTLGCMGLRVTADLALDELKEAWVHDKKYRGGVRFVLLRAIGEPEPGVEVPDDAIARALRRMSS